MDVNRVAQGEVPQRDTIRDTITTNSKQNYINKRNGGKLHVYIGAANKMTLP